MGLWVPEGVRAALARQCLQLPVLAVCGEQTLLVERSQKCSLILRFSGCSSLDVKTWGTCFSQKFQNSFSHSTLSFPPRQFSFPSPGHSAWCSAWMLTWNRGSLNQRASGGLWKGSCCLWECLCSGKFSVDPFQNSYFFLLT